MVGSGVEFDWDEHNTKHLAAHRVTPAEFEQVINNEPVDLECDASGGEERFRSAGVTDQRRMLVVVWVVRGERIRAVTAFPASSKNKRDYLESRR